MNPLTPTRIEPATFRFVAQHLNHWEVSVQILFCCCLATFLSQGSHVRIASIVPFLIYQVTWRNLGKITTGHLSRPQFHLSLLGSLSSLRTQRHVVAKVGTSKDGEKQWQTNLKNVPRMQCAKSHIGSIAGLWFLPDRLQGRILMNEWIMQITIYSIR